MFVRDGEGTNRNFAGNTANSINYSYHVEDETQRATVLNVLALFTSDSKLEAIRTLLAAPLTASLSTDQDPILDIGVRVTVANTSTTIMTPPDGCKYVRISSSEEIFVRTDGAAAADDAQSVRFLGSFVETIPVVSGVVVTGMAPSGNTVVHCTPMKSR